MGSILFGSLIIISGIHRAQLTWAHLFPDRVLFIAPPFRLHNIQVVEPRMPNAHSLHNQLPSGTYEHMKWNLKQSSSNQQSKLSFRTKTKVQNSLSTILRTSSNKVYFKTADINYTMYF